MACLGIFQRGQLEQGSGSQRALAVDDAAIAAAGQLDLAELVAGRGQAEAAAFQARPGGELFDGGQEQGFGGGGAMGLAFDFCQVVDRVAVQIVFRIAATEGFEIDGSRRGVAGQPGRLAAAEQRLPREAMVGVALDQLGKLPVRRLPAIELRERFAVIEPRGFGPRIVGMLGQQRAPSLTGVVPAPWA